MRINYFGKLIDAAGTGEEIRALPAHIRDTNQLREWLVKTSPAGVALADPVVRIAVNDEIIVSTLPVTDNDSVAFLPPVGGG